MYCRRMPEPGRVDDGNIVAARSSDSADFLLVG
jgi:hypothetical protein